MSKLRNFCFTTFVVTDEKRDTLLALDVGYIVFQLEKCPESGREHFQGYCELKKQMRFNAAKRLIGDNAHLEKRKGSAQEAADYCKKDESRVNGPWEAGSISKPGKRSDLLAVKRMIDEGKSETEVADAHFGSWCRYRKSFAAYKKLKTENVQVEKEVHVFYGDAGTGKTRRVYDTEGNDIYSKPDGAWFDGYDDQEVVLFDDYTGDLPLSQFLKLLDRYPMQVPVKGGFRNWCPKRIYITSNLSPEEWYPKAKKEQHRAIARRLKDVCHYRTGMGAGSNEAGRAVQMPSAQVEGFVAN